MPHDRDSPRSTRHAVHAIAAVHHRADTLGANLPQHISPTAAKFCLSCSLRFWFERVACIREATTPALNLGKAVHAALQSFHLARWRGGDESVEAIADAYEREKGPVNFDDAAEREKCRFDGLRVVAAYLDSPEKMKEMPRAVKSCSGRKSPACASL